MISSSWLLTTKREFIGFRLPIGDEWEIIEKNRQIDLVFYEIVLSIPSPNVYKNTEFKFSYVVEMRFVFNEFFSKWFAF